MKTQSIFASTKMRYITGVWHPFKRVMKKYFNDQLTHMANETLDSSAKEQHHQINRRHKNKWKY